MKINKAKRPFRPDTNGWRVQLENGIPFETRPYRRMYRSLLLQMDMLERREIKLEDKYEDRCHKMGRYKHIQRQIHRVSSLIQKLDAEQFTQSHT